MRRAVPLRSREPIGDRYDTERKTGHNSPHENRGGPPVRAAFRVCKPRIQDTVPVPEAHHQPAQPQDDEEGRPAAGRNHRHRASGLGGEEDRSALQPVRRRIQQGNTPDGQGRQPGGHGQGDAEEPAGPDGSHDGDDRQGPLPDGLLRGEPQQGPHQRGAAKGEQQDPGQGHSHNTETLKTTDNAEHHHQRQSHRRRQSAPGPERQGVHVIPRSGQRHQEGYYF